MGVQPIFEEDMIDFLVGLPEEPVIQLVLEDSVMKLSEEQFTETVVFCNCC